MKFTERIRKVLTTFLTIVSFVTVSLGCMMSLPPINKFDSSQYVFIGEVVEIISHEHSLNNKPENAYGIKVEVKEKVILPKSFLTFNVFPLDLTTYCSLTGSTKEEVAKNFPVGSKVAVVAKEASFFKYKPSDIIVSLEASYENRGSITKLDSKSGYETSAISVYNYSDLSKSRQTNENYPAFEFELAKDLFRLKMTENEIKKVSIMERLLSYPDFESLDSKNQTTASGSGSTRQ